MGRPKGSTKPYCVRGHCIAVVGRFESSGRCRQCQRELTRLNYNRVNRGDKLRLSPAPIRKLVTREQAVAYWSAYRGVDIYAARKAVERLWKTSTISLDLADRWCIAVGSHLSLIYPEVYALGEIA